MLRIISDLWRQDKGKEESQCSKHPSVEAVMHVRSQNYCLKTFYFIANGEKYKIKRSEYIPNSFNTASQHKTPLVGRVCILTSRSRHGIRAGN